MIYIDIYSKIYIKYRITDEVRNMIQLTLYIIPEIEYIERIIFHGKKNYYNSLDFKHHLYIYEYTTILCTSSCYSGKRRVFAAEISSLLERSVSSCYLSFFKAPTL